MSMAAAAVKARDEALSARIQVMATEVPEASGLIVEPLELSFQTLKPVEKVKGMPTLRVIAPDSAKERVT